MKAEKTSRKILAANNADNSRTRRKTQLKIFNKQTGKYFRIGICRLTFCCWNIFLFGFFFIFTSLSVYPLDFILNKEYLFFCINLFEHTLEIENRFDLHYYHRLSQSFPLFNNAEDRLSTNQVKSKYTQLQ